MSLQCAHVLRISNGLWFMLHYGEESAWITNSVVVVVVVWRFSFRVRRGPRLKSSYAAALGECIRRCQPRRLRYRYSISTRLRWCHATMAVAAKWSSPPTMTLSARRRRCTSRHCSRPPRPPWPSPPTSSRHRSSSSGWPRRSARRFAREEDPQPMW